MNNQKITDMLLLKKGGGIIMVLGGIGMIAMMLIAASIGADSGSGFGGIIVLFLAVFLLGLLFYAIGNSYLKKHTPTLEANETVNQFFKWFFILFIPAFIIASIFLVALFTGNNESEWNRIKDKTPNELTQQEWEYVEGFLDYVDEKNTD